jgi:hypothetical protein
MLSITEKLTLKDLVRGIKKERWHGLPDAFRACELVQNNGTCTVLSVNGTLVESKMCTFTLESTHFEGPEPVFVNV